MMVDEDIGALYVEKNNSYIFTSLYDYLFAWLLVCLFACLLGYLVA